MIGWEDEIVALIIGTLFLWGIVKVMRGDIHDDYDQHL
jgi:hypothetical protein